MTVKDLKQLLKGVPNDLLVFLMEEPKLGGFVFVPACMDESGVIELGPPEEGSDEFGEGQGAIFILAKHGALSEEDDIADDVIGLN